LVVIIISAKGVQPMRWKKVAEAFITVIKKKRCSYLTLYKKKISIHYSKIFIGYAL